MGMMGAAEVVEQPIQNLDAEIAILLSAAIWTAGYHAETSEKNFASVMRCYTCNEFTMRLLTDPALEADLESALDALMTLPINQRESLVAHIAEITVHDGISTPEEVEILARVTRRLLPRSRAA